ncbi:hypothetical protein [Saccharothrix sp. HUAS TT1]|uniref:hypothetical protein n=1 Tax=unclassified Saccharothrix TaxID=2593673 RepID=UPI00345BA743
MAAASCRLAVAACRRLVAGWRLAAGGWWLATAFRLAVAAGGDWQRAAGLVAAWWPAGWLGWR